MHVEYIKRQERSLLVDDDEKSKRLENQIRNHSSISKRGNKVDLESV
jgi:hypothetical protein